MALWAVTNICNAMTTTDAFKVTVTPRARNSRLVHSHGQPENSPEMLGPARPKSEGFSAQLRTSRSTQH